MTAPVSTNRKVLVELCAGTASVSLWALSRVDPLTGYMGSKRRDRATLVRLLDADRPDEVHLVDAGPWGDVWQTLRTAEGRRAVAETLRAWAWWGDLALVWPMLLFAPPTHAAYRAAQYLCLQARASGCIPIWWNATRGRWESPSGSRLGACDASKRAKMGTKQAAQRTSHGAAPNGRRVGKLYRSHPSRGLIRIETLAERVEALDVIDWSRVHVHRCDVADAPVIAGARVYFDPPYHGAPRYAVLLPRAQVLDVAGQHATVADRVVVSEAEPLPCAWTAEPLLAWAAEPLRFFDEEHGKPEWLTMTAKRGEDLLQMVAVARRTVAAQRLRSPAAQMGLAL